MTTPAWLDIVDEARRESAAGRPDLSNRLQQLQQRLVQPDFRVLVIGTAKQGKSQLLNSMVNTTACPVHDQVRVPVPTVLRYGETARGELVTSPTELHGLAEAADADRTPVAPEQLAAEVIKITGAESTELVRAELTLPRPLLATGLVFIDGPDIAALSSYRLDEYLSTVDAVLIASDAARPLTPEELDLVGTASRHCARIACVRTKTDLALGWKQIMEADAAAVAGIVRGVPMVGVSSALRLHALKTNDEAVNTESGIPALIGYLQKDLAAQADQAARHAVARAVVAVADQITAVGRAQLLVQPPQDDSAAMQELLAAQRRMEDLRRRGVRWQHALSDGMADIISDIDHDLRERTRVILRESDRAFNKADPLKVWDDFAAWLVENLSAAVIDNFGWAAERTRWLAEQISGFFSEYDHGYLPHLDVAVPLGVEDRLSDLEKPEIEPVKIGHKVVTGLRGSYSGLLMFGMVTSLTGLPLINVVSVGAGALLGGKTLREDSEVQLKRRQATAKQTVQRHVDDVVFHASKYSRDSLRHVQRALRNHFSNVAEELQEFASESINRATLEARTDAVERDRKLRELTGQLERLSLLRRRAESLVGTPMIAA